MYVRKFLRIKTPFCLKIISVLCLFPTSDVAVIYFGELRHQIEVGSRADVGKKSKI